MVCDLALVAEISRLISNRLSVISDRTPVVILLFYGIARQGRIKHLVGPTHFTMPGPQSLC